MTLWVSKSVTSPVWCNLTTAANLAGGGLGGGLGGGGEGGGEGE